MGPPQSTLVEFNADMVHFGPHKKKSEASDGECPKGSFLPSKCLVVYIVQSLIIFPVVDYFCEHITPATNWGTRHAKPFLLLLALCVAVSWVFFISPSQLCFSKPCLMPTPFFHFTSFNLGPLSKTHLNFTLKPLLH